MEPSTYEQREKAFQEGDFLRGLKDKTTSNRAKWVVLPVRACTDLQQRLHRSTATVNDASL